MASSLSNTTKNPSRKFFWSDFVSITDALQATNSTGNDSRLIMNKISIDKHTSYYNDIGIGSELIEQYKSFLLGFANTKYPPIFESEHLSQLIGVTGETLHNMTFATERYYRSFNIKKRSGGVRNIRSPYPSLLEAQRWVLDNILRHVEISRCATGFTTGSSIKRNAQTHCNRTKILKVDIKDFFPSIGMNRVFHIFKKIGYPDNVCLLLSKICCLNDELPQGAATSPTISNIVCKFMDERFYHYAKKNSLRYTRYADDMCFSGEEIHSTVLKFVNEVISENGFTLNEDKTRFFELGSRKIITGLDITTGSPRVTRVFRRKIMQDVYFVWAHGLSMHLARRKIFNPHYLDHLAGRVKFWESIEPNAPQMRKTMTRLDEVLRVQSKMAA